MGAVSEDARHADRDRREGEQRQRRGGDGFAAAHTLGARQCTGRDHGDDGGDNRQRDERESPLAELVARAHRRSGSASRSTA